MGIVSLACCGGYNRAAESWGLETANLSAADLNLNPGACLKTRGGEGLPGPRLIIFQLVPVIIMVLLFFPSGWAVPG